MSEPPSAEPGLFLPDVNVLVALTNPAHVHHAQAHQWLSTIEQFATTPVTESGLVRMLLNPAVTGQPVSGQQAIGILTGLRADVRATFLPDGSSLSSPRIDTVGLAGHRQVTDVHLVNLAALHEATLVTFDRRITQALVAADQRFVHVLD
ncbi:TA system VapC family ribonuclease toxin [Mycobacterium sp. pUA109]|uniref:TA system VapC family ribonuclease toxin n=1 Tax=Mycobacterium sp. pUA109 TaxID=3238982 RepID=UPI00351ACCAE